MMGWSDCRRDSNLGRLLPSPFRQFLHSVAPIPTILLVWFHPIDSLPESDPRMAVCMPSPWRSAWLPAAATVIALIAGLPLYLRSPLWCDVTLYDLAARNLLAGGIHYRDLFDTNLPGFVWLMTAIRWLFGPSAIVVRIADLVIVCGIVAILDRLAKWGGATRATRWWALAGIAFLYPCAVEMVHAQRDTWMTLPALAAVALRLRRTFATAGTGAFAASDDADAPGRCFWQAALEGLLWGAAVWLKPHIVLMAAGVWLLSARRLVSDRPRPWLFLGADLAGNVAGGLLVGGCGVAWLVASGTWPYFWDVMTVWNAEYTRLARLEFPIREEQELAWFPPWSLWLVPTVPLALLSIIDAAPWASRRACDHFGPGPIGRLLPGWLWDRQSGVDARFVRGVLGGLYLVWAAQAFLIQRGFMYAHLPETLLMIGLWAAHRWAMPAIPLAWMAATSALWLIADANSSFREDMLAVAFDKHVSADPGEERYFVRHAMADRGRMACWPICWRFDLTAREQFALWDNLRRIREHEASIGWEDLADVADYLRSQGVKDHEVIAWNDSTHAVYLLLDVKPGIRFMHTSTAQAIGSFGAATVMKELAETAGTARFAVGDLEWCAVEATPEERLSMLGPSESATQLLPPAILPWQRASFPYNQPAVYRSRGGLGRYTVHKLTPPFGNWQEKK